MQTLPLYVREMQINNIMSLLSVTLLPIILTVAHMREGLILRA